MHTPVWDAVDEFFDRTLVTPDAVFDDVLHRSEAAGLPAISVTASQGKLLALLAESIGARRALEIGTLGGFSAIWIARALAPGGRLVTIEAEPRHAVVARESFARAGVLDRIDLREGQALDVLPQLTDTKIDFTFIDADKPKTPAYLDWAIRLSRPGALIVIDNVVREGEIADAAKADASALAMRRVCEQAGQDARISATAVQTVGSKGYDGFLLARVR
ncbi:MAG TPA: O-methyltransferase [Vicinamibacterales bacterium]|jgi:predicted O-methyltransferase YrrM|nr:O-methyltransferase [Vicinamibacterales bacterium]